MSVILLYLNRILQNSTVNIEYSLFYLDPPYLETAGYGVEFGRDHYELMADLARNIEGMMVISLNDIPEARNIFQGLHMDNKSIKYTVGGGAVQKQWSY